MSQGFLVALALAGMLSGCSGASGIRCEDPEYYAGSGEIAPVQVPEDLSLPDEAESLQIPPESDGSEVTETLGPCLESPPEYFEQGNPG